MRHTNNKSNSGLKTQIMKEQVIDRTRFVNGKKNTQSLCSSRVWEEPSPRCSDINVCSADNKGEYNLPTVEVLSPRVNDLNVDNSDSSSNQKKERRIK